MFHIKGGKETCQLIKTADLRWDTGGRIVINDIIRSIGKTDQNIVSMLNILKLLTLENIHILKKGLVQVFREKEGMIYCLTCKCFIN